MVEFAGCVFAVHAMLMSKDGYGYYWVLSLALFAGTCESNIYIYHYQSV
jgi:hypothetical protein